MIVMSVELNLLNEVQLKSMILFVELEEMLNNINIPFTSKTSTRRGFGKHRKATFGLVRQRYTGKTTYSVFTKNIH